MKFSNFSGKIEDAAKLTLLLPVMRQLFTVYNDMLVAKGLIKKVKYPQPLSRQLTFSDDLVLRIILLGHHRAVVYPWEFESSFGDRMPFLTPTCYRLGKKCWELETFFVMVEIPSPRTI